VDLASDQCTLHYTSESDSIKQFNVCTNTQLPDFVTGLPGPCYAHRILSDGSELVACSTVVEHVSSSGSIVKTYSPGGTGNLFALNLDPDGTSFWTGDVSSGDVWRIDIATGAVLKTFNTGINTALGGLSIVGEITAAVGPPSATITTPPDGASYQVGQVVNANYSCAAGSNGTLQSCVGSVANGSPIDTSTAGPHTFTVTATDTDGQTATAVSHYTVNKVPTFINANPVLVQLSGLKIYLKPSATLYRTSPTAPLAGKTLKFYAGSTFVCQGTTDSNGLASCSGLLPLLQTTLSLGYTATFDGDSTYLPSSGKGPLLK
jgi:hypothetical protein